MFGLPNARVAVAEIVGEDDDDVRRNGPLRRDTCEAGYNGSQHQQRSVQDGPSSKHSHASS